MVYKFRTKPDVYQIEAFKRALTSKRFGIFFQQRLGKTKTAIDICGASYLKYGYSRVLIVCPLVVRGVWEEQIDEHLPIDITYQAAVVTKPQHLQAGDGLNFVIINYDKLATYEKTLKKYNPEVIIFDESHLLANAMSKRSRVAYRVAREAQSVLMLTGTPVPKRHTAVFGQFKVMNAELLGTSFPKFRDEYCVMGGYLGKQVVGAKNIEKLSDIMAQHSIRVLRADVLKEPNIENVLVPVELEPSARKVYKELRDEFIAEWDTGTITADIAGVRVMRLQQFCGGFIPSDIGGELLTPTTAKLDATVDLVSTLVEGGEQVVVFYRFSAEGTALASRIAGSKIINGSVPEVTRNKLVKDFQSSVFNVLIIQISTGAVGICLDKAHTNVFYSLTFRLVDLLQARDRIMGRGQTQDVTNYFIAAKGTVDYKIMKTLKNNEDLASQISDTARWLV